MLNVTMLSIFDLHTNGDYLPKTNPKHFL